MANHRQVQLTIFGNHYKVTIFNYMVSSSKVAQGLKKVTLDFGDVINNYNNNSNCIR